MRSGRLRRVLLAPTLVVAVLIVVPLLPVFAAEPAEQSQSEEVLIWGFNTGLEEFWSKGMATLSHNKNQDYITEGTGSLRVSLFGVNAKWGWVEPINFTLIDMPEYREKIEALKKEIVLDVFVPESLALQKIRVRSWSHNQQKWLDISEWVELKPGLNRNIHINVDVDWNDVQVLAFDIQGSENLDGDFYIDNIRFLK